MTDPSSHPVAHVDAALRYEWMRQDCAALVSARQSREDSLIQTITQISSAALLAIPGFLLGSEIEIPSLRDGWLLYLGILAFVLAMIAAMLEQHISAKAYKVHEKIVHNYYLLDSEVNCDQPIIDRVDKTRIFACVFFGAAVLMSAVGLTSLMRKENGNSTTPTATTTAPTSAATAGEPGVRGRRSPEVGTIADSAAAQKIAPN